MTYEQPLPTEVAQRQAMPERVAWPTSVGLAHQVANAGATPSRPYIAPLVNTEPVARTREHVENVEERLRSDPTINLPQLFHGKRREATVRVEIKNEKPWHRTAVLLCAAGWAAKDIAMEVGYGTQAVLTLMKQPWFNEAVGIVIERNGTADALEIFKAEIMGAQATVLEIMNNEKAPPTVRLAAANSVIDRVKGKAKQSVEISQLRAASDDPVAEAARLQQQVEELRKQNEGIL